MLARMWRKGNPPTLSVGVWIGAATVEKCGGFSKKLKRELPYDLAIPHLGIDPKKKKKKSQNTNLKRYMHPKVHSSHYSRLPRDGHNLSVHWHMNKMWYIPRGIVRSHEKEWDFLPFAATWMHVEGIMLSEISQKDRERVTGYDTASMWNLKAIIN